DVPRFRLGIDFGTSTTIAVLRRPEGRVQQLLFDGSPLLSSAVLLGPDGRLHTGRDAAHLAHSFPERLEPNPKRRVDDGGVLLGDAEVGVRDLVAAVLRRVAAEATRVAGPVSDVTLTHPADWGAGRRALLTDAARLAGFDDVRLVPEPVAAATFLATTQEIPVHGCVMVYDLGAGTCDVTLLRRHPDGFEPFASAGLNDLGGLDVDAAVVGFLEATYGRLWTDAATRRRLWDEVRSAKEMLSRASGTVIMVPALGREVPLGREQLEGLMRPVLRPSVAMVKGLLAEDGVRPAEITALFLVGGSSRIPLVATMLHEALGIPPVVAEQPELVVAEGALIAAAPRATVRPEARPGASFGASSVAPSGVPAGPLVGEEPTVRVPAMARRRPRSRRRLIAGMAAVVLVVAAGALLLNQLPSDGDDDPWNGPSVAPARYDLAKVPDNLCDSIDLSPFFALYEREASAPSPRRNVMAAAGSSSCQAVRLHDNGMVRATFSAEVRVTPEQSTAEYDYKQRVSGDAALNEQPVQLPDLGDEAVVFEMKGATAQARTMTTLRLGVRDGNLVWEVHLTVDRQDKVGWTAAQKQDLRDRLVTVTRAALPKVLTAVR
ncbi:Hsp70 family protein, partial [Dactylosporangium sp. NPDC005555]|uniref:Hsp70 family protein n=1 Tax=Dactylosporangium sp. NPDC005555 TaxID=3154889 RepID=UPI0033B73E97